MKYLLKALVLFFSIIGVSCGAGVTTSSSTDSGLVYDIVNPGFEAGLSGWTETGLSDMGYVILTNECSNGVQSAYLYCDYTNSNNGYKGLMQYVAYQNNRTYALTAFLKDGEPNYKIMMIELCDTASNSLTVPYTNIARISGGWTGWTNVSLALLPTNVSGFIKVLFKVEKNSSGTGYAELFVDDVVLTNF